MQGSEIVDYIENFPELKKKFLGVFSIGKNKIILLEKIIS